MIGELVASGYDAAREDIEGQPQDNRDSLKEFTQTFGKLIPILYERQLNQQIEMYDMARMKKVQDDMQKSIYEQYEKQQNDLMALHKIKNYNSKAIELTKQQTMDKIKLMFP